MDIEEFIKESLAQITRAVNNNKDGGDILYTVPYDEGVDFDLAVTTTDSESTDSKVGGGVKIKIVNAEGLKASQSSATREVTSRIKFRAQVRRETKTVARIR